MQFSNLTVNMRRNMTLEEEEDLFSKQQNTGIRSQEYSMNKKTLNTKRFNRI